MQPCARGDSYQEAVTNAQEVIDLLIQIYGEENKLMSTPQVFQVA